MRASWLGPAASVTVAVVTAIVLRGPGTERVAGSAEHAGSGEADIEEVWLADCAVCHGSDALGTPRGPSLAGDGAAYTHYMLSTGRMPLDDPADAPARRPVAYSDEVIAGLVDYVAELVPGGPGIPKIEPGGDLSAGGVLYRGQCAACHAWSGDGGALLGRAAPPLRPATPVQVAEAVRLGPGTMPAFGRAALTDAELASLSRYVQYLDEPRDEGGWALGHLGPLAEGAVAWFVGIGVLLFALRRIGTRS